MGSWLPWRKLASNPPGLDWPALPWQSRGLYALLLGLANDAGRIPLGRLGLPSLADGLNAPWSEIEPCFSSLLAAGWAEVDGSDVNLPHFADSQRAATTAERVAEFRKRVRNEPVTPEKRPSNEKLPDCNESVTKRELDKKEIRSEENREDQKRTEELIPTTGIASRPVVTVEPQPTRSEVRAAEAATRAAKKAAEKAAAKLQREADRAAKQEADRLAKEAKRAAWEQDQADAKAKRAATTQTNGSTLFASYRDAFLRRYHTEPLRDAKTNAHFARIAKRTIEGRPEDVSQEDAIMEASRVCSAYLRSSMPLYLQSNHTPGLLEKDWHKLLTEHRTGRPITPQLAHRSDADTKREEANQRFFEQFDEKLAAIATPSRAKPLPEREPTRDELEELFRR